MERAPATAIEFFRKAGIEVTITPQVFVVSQRVVAECLRPSPASPNGRLRPSISFDPNDPESVKRARIAAGKQYVPPWTCGEYCNLPCILRRLENPTDDYLMEVFGTNDTGSDKIR
jgi:hypothetical protein